ncbi:hypothetical protein IGI04_042258 [Brassica rapa subsp. trilocularis]|uniref:Uncharacterized protein n=1 Tax=Brassica rapa subsp. trilocularis TaxID=1813537 RepID=A0ABQ7KIQ7_BRACM|nr:hypothetical protein IGI04_042258 [Brassica rapa subsp. trilocularis]
MGKESEEEAELVRKNKMLRDQMTEQMNQTMISTMADMLKASMKELREEMRQELRQATGQGHSNESRRNRPTPVRQEHAGSQETDNYYSRNRTEHNPTERTIGGLPAKFMKEREARAHVSDGAGPSNRGAEGEGREGDGKALVTYSATPNIRGNDHDFIRRSEMDALIKMLKENALRVVKMLELSTPLLEMLG